MAKATQALTTGLKFMGGGAVSAYTLEYLSDSKRHKLGSYDTIVVPYVELGRSSSCAVQFDEDAGTVSRKHAAIEKRGNDYVIKNISGTNPTLVNGQPVSKEYYLKNGDEIQLSYEGPKMRFNVSDTGTAKMGMTKRLNLVMQQAVKPYKMAAMGLVAFVVLLTAGGIYGFMQLNLENRQLSEQMEFQKKITRAQADSLAELNKKNNMLLSEVKNSKEDIQRQFDRERQKLLKQNQELQKSFTEFKSKAGSATNYAEVIEPLKNKTLALYLTGYTVEGPNGPETVELEAQCMCTGFMLEGGVFATARHCIDALMSGSEDLNFLDHSGINVVTHFKAKSYDGSIEFDFTDDQMNSDFSGDQLKQVSYKGRTGAMRIPDYFHGKDWAYVQTGYNDGMAFDPSLSLTLKAGTQLFVLGYSYGTRFRESGNMEPYFSTAKVTQSGIEQGTVRVTEAGWDGGNSGGPVFALDENGEAVVIGLVTGKYQQPKETANGDVVWIPTSIKVVTPLGNFLR